MSAADRETALQPTPEVLGAILRGETPANGAAGEPSLPEEDEERRAAESERLDDQTEGAERRTSGEDPKDDETPDGDGATGAGEDDKVPGDDAPPRMTIREAADALGMRASDLYQQLLVGMPENRGDVTLDELKGAYLERAELEDQREALELERSEYDHARTEREVTELRNRRELQTILGFARSMPPELVAAAQQQHTEAMARESELLLAAKPEFRDPAKYDAARETYWSLISRFGFSRGEFETIADHRLLLFADYTAELERQLEDGRAKLREAREAREAERKNPRTGQRRGTPEGRRERITRAARAPGATNETKARAVAELLNRR